MGSEKLNKAVRAAGFVMVPDDQMNAGTIVKSLAPTPTPKDVIKPNLERAAQQASPRRLRISFSDLLPAWPTAKA